MRAVTASASTCSGSWPASSTVRSSGSSEVRASSAANATRWWAGSAPVAASWSSHRSVRPAQGVGDDGEHRVDLRGRRAGAVGGLLGLGERGAVALDVGRADDVGERPRAAVRRATFWVSPISAVSATLRVTTNSTFVVPAAGGLHVGGGRVGAGPEDAVAGVDVAAVRGVHRGGVGERDPVADVGGGQLDRVAELLGAVARRGR